MYYNKYLKYKFKYTQLKYLLFGGDPQPPLYESPTQLYKSPPDPPPDPHPKSHSKSPPDPHSKSQPKLPSILLHKLSSESS